MPQNFNVIIADTTCFILLDKIGEMDLLRTVWGRITTTPVIATEFGSPLPDWIDIIPVQDVLLQNALQIEVDAGEASAIALATELAPALLILDDLEARRLAKQLNLNFTGTLGLILRAKKSGHIPLIKPIMEKIQSTNFRISHKLYTELLIQAEEVF
jgi:predicted nucleic acid-binding protein